MQGVEGAVEEGGENGEGVQGREGKADAFEKRALRFGFLLLFLVVVVVVVEGGRGDRAKVTDMDVQTAGLVHEAGERRAQHRERVRDCAE